MKKLLLCLAFLLLLSCDKNCDEEMVKLNKQYQDALWNANGSTAAVLKLHSDYQFRLGQLNERCN